MNIFIPNDSNETYIQNFFDISLSDSTNSNTLEDTLEENLYRNQNEILLDILYNYQQTENQSFKIETTSYEINNENNTNENHILNNKRKRNKNNTARKTHDKTESGNIRSKIKNHFHKFIVQFLNAKIREYNYGKQIMKFRKINYKITNIRNKKYNKELVESKLKEIFKYDISPKYKNKSKNQNLKTLNSIYSTELKKFLDMTYEEFYNKFFLNDEHKIGLDNKVIFFSDFIKNETEKGLKKKDSKINIQEYIKIVNEISQGYINHFKDCKKSDESDKNDKKQKYKFKIEQYH
jgi:hypothetical protein